MLKYIIKYEHYKLLLYRTTISIFYYIFNQLQYSELNCVRQHFIKYVLSSILKDKVVYLHKILGHPN